MGAVPSITDIYMIYALQQTLNPTLTVYKALPTSPKWVGFVTKTGSICIPGSQKRMHVNYLSVVLQSVTYVIQVYGFDPIHCLS